MSMSNVRELREITGAGIVDCQKALKEAGSVEAAIDILRKKGLAKAAKKGGRATAEGLIYSHVSEDRKKFSLIELKCETDFVARTDNFKSAVKVLATEAMNNNSKDREEFLGATIDGQTVEDYIKGLIAQFGENTVLGRVVSGETSGFHQSYIHSNNKLSVIIEADGEANEKNLAITKDIAMHAAAMSPLFLNKSEVDSSVLEKEKEIYRAELASSGKPEGVIERIVEGKISKFYESSCLLEQKFVKDPSLSVAEYAKDLKILSFIRLVLGE